MSREVQIKDLSPAEFEAFRKVAKARGSETHAAREVFVRGLAASEPAAPARPAEVLLTPEPEEAAE